MDSCYAYEQSSSSAPPRRLNSVYVADGKNNDSAYLLDKDHGYSTAKPLDNLYAVTALKSFADTKTDTVMAGPMTQAELLAAVNRLPQAGSFQPVICNGQLHFVSADPVDTNTAYSVDSNIFLKDSDLLNIAFSKTVLMNTACDQSVKEKSANIQEAQQTFDEVLPKLSYVTADNVAKLATIPGFRKHLHDLKSKLKVKKLQKQVAVAVRNAKSPGLETALDCISGIPYHKIRSPGNTGFTDEHTAVSQDEFSEMSTGISLPCDTAICPETSVSLSSIDTLATALDSNFLPTSNVFTATLPSAYEKEYVENLELFKADPSYLPAPTPSDYYNVAKAALNS